MLNMTDLHDYSPLISEDPDFLYNLIPNIPENYMEKLFSSGKDFYWYQKVSLYIHLLKRRRFIHSFYMGLGKTLLFLAIHEYYTKNKLVANPVTLYVTSSALSVKMNIPKSIMDFTDCRFEYLSKYNIDTPSAPGTILLTTYQGMASAFKDELEQDGKKSWIFNEDRIKKFSSMVDIFVFDEIHWLKGNDSLYFTIANLLVNGRHPPTKHKKVHKFLPGYEDKVVVGLTGTLMNKNPIDLWSTSHLIDEGDTFGNYNEFSTNFFTRQTRYSPKIKTTISKLELKIGSEKILNKRLNGILVYRGKENLPPLTYADPVYYSLAPELKAAYNRIIADKGVFDEIDHHDDSAVPKSKYPMSKIQINNSIMKLMQVCSGFVYYYTAEVDANGKPIRKVKELISDEKNTKLQALYDILKEAEEYSEKKTVVMTMFQHTGIMVERFLNKKGYEVFFVKNSITGQKRINVVNQFKDSKNKHAILIGNIDAIGTSIELPEADKTIYVENSLSVISKGQADSRILRAGHAKVGDIMTIFEIIAPKTVEERNLLDIKQGRNLASNIFNPSVSISDNLLSDWIL